MTESESMRLLEAVEAKKFRIEVLADGMILLGIGDAQWGYQLLIVFDSHIATDLMTGLHRTIPVARAAVTQAGDLVH